MSDLSFNSGGNDPAARTTPGADQGAQGEPQNQPANNGDGSDQSFIEYNGRALSKEEVLKKIENADQFIETLKSEREQDRQRLESIESQLGKAGRIEEVLSALQGNNGQGSQGQGNEPGNEADDGQQPALDVETLTQGVLEKLTAREQAQAEENNWKSVTNTLTEHFGEKTDAKVREVAQENGMSVEEAANLARKRPKVFLKLFDELGPSRTSTPLTSAHRRSTPQGANRQQPTGPSGYMQARTTRDQVAIYKQRLAEFSER